MLPLHPMQLTRDYKARLEPRFLSWYLTTFTSARRIYGHWSVSGYCSPDRAYHREVLFVDGHAVVSNPSGVALTDDLNGHTDGRNTDAIALCIGCEDKTATTVNLGDQPPTPQEILAFLDITAVACINCHIPVSGLMTHAEAANNLDFPRVDDPNIPAPPSYGPGSDDFQRWDLHVRIHTNELTMVPLFIGSTALYPVGQLPRGPLNAREYVMPPGWAYFPDWWRGEVVLRIQDRTRAKWDE